MVRRAGQPRRKSTAPDCSAPTVSSSAAMPSTMRHDGPEHVLCFAPTRSGKGVGLVVPTLLTWPGSCIVHDIKGENVVGIAGTYSIEETEDDGRWGLTEALNIKGMFPPAPMIDLPEETPRWVKHHLEKSFTLYWVDYGACLNAVRSAGEQILDELNVA